MPGARKVVFLTGAPEVDGLDWDSHHLTSSFVPQVLRFLGDEENDTGTKIALTQASHPLAKWRTLPLSKFKDIENQPSAREDARFLSFHAPGTNHGLEHLSFLEHSLAQLQNLDSSQIENPDGTSGYDTTAWMLDSLAAMDTTLSFPTSDSLASYSFERLAQQIVDFNGPVMDLKQIPTAQHLQAIQPQTMTANIVAAVISVQPVRTVRLRKRNGEMDVIEILLGDETRSGFNTSFWLPPADSVAASRSPKKGLRELLTGLRSGNILLITSIALSEFKGSVSGQSLDRRITKNNTTVTVLSEDVIGLSMSVAAKVTRVRDWSKNFIGLTNKRPTTPELPLSQEYRKRQRSTLDLPPDTQSQYD